MYIFFFGGGGGGGGGGLCVVYTKTINLCRFAAGLNIHHYSPSLRSIIIKYRLYTV